MMKGIIPILLVALLVLTGCSSNNISPVDLGDKGFSKIKSYQEDKVDVTVYNGAVTADAAADIFYEWAIGEGWEKTDKSFDYFTGYSGRMYQKDGKAMMINIADMGPMTTVLVMVSNRTE